jgi:hypothetical protein
VADQWERNPGDGHQADGHSRVDDRLRSQECHDSHSQQSAERFTSRRGDSQSCREEQQVHQERPAGSDESKPLAYEAKDKIRAAGRQMITQGVVEPRPGPLTSLNSTEGEDLL